MKPKVSVIIPVYNSAQYINECVRSAQNQTLKDIEIICINDGSTDGSLGLLRELAIDDHRIRIINKPNSGFGNSINVGISSARGDYLAILESDDYILPSMYEELYKCARKNGFPDFVKCDFSRFYGDGEKRTFQYVPLTKDDSYYSGVFNPRERVDLFNLYNLNQPGIYSLQFLKDYSVKLNESPGAAYQDNGFWFQVFSQAESAVFIHKSLYMLRRDNPNSSVNSKEKVFCICDEYDFIREKLISNKDNLHPDILKMCAKMRFSNYKWTCGRIAAEFRKDFVLRFASDFQMLMDAGEIDPIFIGNKNFQELHQLLSNPIEYYYVNWSWYDQKKSYQLELLKKNEEIARLTLQVKKLKSSNSWMIGRFVTAIPRAIKRKLRRFK